MKPYRQLTQEERYIITAQRIAGNSQAHIARVLNRHPSTIGRELVRNRTHHDGNYRAEKAHTATPSLGADAAAAARTLAPRLWRESVRC